MPKSWKKYKQVIQYKYGKFDYIMLPRSQKDGYCHYHIILNSDYIPQTWLDTKRKKYSNMGYVSIQTNQTLAYYLTNDFFKDNEYVIPENKRHFYGSSEVKKYLTINNSKNIENYPLNYNHDEGNKIQQYEQQIQEINGYPLPLEEYLSEYYQKYVQNTSLNHHSNKQQRGGRGRDDNQAEAVADLPPLPTCLCNPKKGLRDCCA
jgi:hypothetical protein